MKAVLKYAIVVAAGLLLAGCGYKVRQTRLTQVDEGGDFAFEGEITGYTSTTASVSGSSETALLNRLTITVNVRFTNAVDESMSWKKTFSAFEDFDSSKLLNEI